MITDVIIQALSLCFACISFIVFWGNYSRIPKEPKTLTPNILLTRYPLIFVSGKKSVFYFKNFWNDLPLFLRAHGHEVYNLALPWKHNRRQFFIEWLKSSPQKGHFILTEDSLAELKDLIPTERFTTTVLFTSQKQSGFLWKIISSFHQRFTSPDAQLPPPRLSAPERQEVLNTITHLAEIDFI